LQSWIPRDLTKKTGDGFATHYPSYITFLWGSICVFHYFLFCKYWAAPATGDDPVAGKEEGDLRRLYELKKGEENGEEEKEGEEFEEKRLFEAGLPHSTSKTNNV